LLPAKAKAPPGALAVPAFDVGVDFFAAAVFAASATRAASPSRKLGAAGIVFWQTQVMMSSGFYSRNGK
jgi:hypothetical protein